ncbi:MAG: hypothetical protein Q8P82_03305, partial [bacterium]|nr:hypothetical protein [bacterium]
MFPKKRMYEVIPATLVWGAFLVAIILSFLEPLWAIYFIIVFDLLWLFRVLYFVTYLIISWRHFRRTTRVDWYEQLVKIQNWERIHHLIFLPTYHEPLAVIRETMHTLLKVQYPKKKFIIVLAGEERDQEQFLANAAVIEAEFGSQVHSILVTVHPKDLPDEIPGKGSNLHYAGQKAQELIDKLGIPYEDVVVSSFDVDTCVHSRYFAYLTYLYLTHPTPTRTSYQPVALYSNTIWDAPAPVRVAAFGTTFWLMTELARPERLFTFSSHS